MEIYCVTCGKWIATVYTDEQGNIIASACSSVFTGIDEPCEDCIEAAESGRYERGKEK